MVLHNFYFMDFFQIDMSDSTASLSESMISMMSMSASPPLLGPGEVIKPSGKFTKPTRIPGKKYCKDEVVIRNADSGKGNIINGFQLNGVVVFGISHKAYVFCYL